MSDWENLLEDNKYEPVHDALCASIELLEKYYRRSNDTDAYFIAHGEFTMLSCLTCVIGLRFVDYSS